MKTKSDSVIHIRISEAEKARWKELAKAESKTLSSWIKEKLSNESK